MTIYLKNWTPSGYDAHPPNSDDRAARLVAMAAAASGITGLKIKVLPLSEQFAVELGDRGSTAWPFEQAWTVVYGLLAGALAAEELAGEVHSEQALQADDAAAEPDLAPAPPLAPTIPSEILVDHDEHRIWFDGVPFPHEIAAEPPPLVVPGDPLDALQLTIYADRVVQQMTGDGTGERLPGAATDEEVGEQR